MLKVKCHSCGRVVRVPVTYDRNDAVFCKKCERRFEEIYRGDRDANDDEKPNKPSK